MSPHPRREAIVACTLGPELDRFGRSGIPNYAVAPECTVMVRRRFDALHVLARRGQVLSDERVVVVIGHELGVSVLHARMARQLSGAKRIAELYEDLTYNTWLKLLTH